MDEQPPQPATPEASGERIIDEFLEHLATYLKEEETGKRATAHLKGTPDYPRLDLETLLGQRERPETMHAARVMEKIRNGTITREDLRGFESGLLDPDDTPRQDLPPLFWRVLVPFFNNEANAIIVERERREKKNSI